MRIELGASESAKHILLRSSNTFHYGEFPPENLYFLVLFRYASPEEDIISTKYRRPNPPDPWILSLTLFWVFGADSERSGVPPYICPCHDHKCLGLMED